jgi:hypothetical protein
MSTSRQNNNFVDYQQPVYMLDENSRIYAVMNNVPLASSNEISQEQQIVFHKAPMNYQPINNQQTYVYPQQLPNSQIGNQYSSSSLIAQHNQQQQVSSSMCFSPCQDRHLYRYCIDGRSFVFFFFFVLSLSLSLVFLQRACVFSCFLVSCCFSLVGELLVFVVHIFPFGRK